tara:strand:- start:105 stop:557 length:453 start_codon:yes stop_codon:yes gene_type:complete
MVEVREVQLRYGAVIGKIDLPDTPILSQIDSGPIFYKKLEGELQEVFLVLMVNARNKSMELIEVSRGTLTQSLVHPREVFRAAIVSGACSIIIAHNHPSGESGASGEDKEVTERLVKSGKLIGIKVLDHIIIADEKDPYSMLLEHRDLFE